PLWRLCLWVCVAVYVLVMLTLLLGLFWRRRKRMADADEPPVTKPDAPGERRAWAIVSTCIVLTIVVLFVLMVSEFTTLRHLHQFAGQPDPVVIKVIGHQWWWEFEYEDEQNPVNVFTTANEMHVPVGRPVRVQLDSRDVI